MDKSNYTFQTTSFEVFDQYFVNGDDLLILVADNYLLFVRADFSVNTAKVTYSRILYPFSSFYLERETGKPNFSFYFISFSKIFYCTDISITEQSVTASNRLFMNLPIEVKNLTILNMIRVETFFLFILFDNVQNQVYLCTVQAYYPANIRAFLNFQYARYNNLYHIFRSTQGNLVYVTGNDSVLMYQLTLSPKSTLRIEKSLSFEVDFNLQISARNNLYVKQLPFYFKGPPPGLSFSHIFSQIVKMMSRFYIECSILLCLLACLVFHLLCKKWIRIKKVSQLQSNSKI